MEVAGVDGCDGGWVVVWAQIGHPLRILNVAVQPTFGQVLHRTRDCRTVAVDIPIGLSDDGRREPDVEARKVLSPLRHNSVFPAPVRPVLGVLGAGYREACSVSARARVDGKKISKQTYFMSFRIKDVDRLLDPDAQKRVIEIHPEVCFWALNGQNPLSGYKRTPEGEFQRLEILSQVFADDLASIASPLGAARDDFLDACAAAWSAARFATGKAETLPREPCTDSRGLLMRIVY